MSHIFRAQEKVVVHVATRKQLSISWVLRAMNTLERGSK
jgi:hypothetical protein